MTSPLNSVALDSGRWYEWKGERFLSVTNILDKAKSKPALVGWANKLTAEQAQITLDAVLATGQLPPKPTVIRQRKGQPTPVQVDWPTYWKSEYTRVKDASADRGTIIHDWAERWVLGQEPSPPPGLEQECIGIMRCFEKYGIEAVAAEATVYNRTFKYAGTGDLFATVGAWGGGTFMLDYKTGKSAWPETAFQLAAYRYGEFIGIGDSIEEMVPETVGGGVLHVDFGTTHLIPYRCGPREFAIFQHMCAAAQYFVEELDSAMNHTALVS